MPGPYGESTIVGNPVSARFCCIAALARDQSMTMFRVALVWESPCGKSPVCAIGTANRLEVFLAVRPYCLVGLLGGELALGELLRIEYAEAFEA